MGRLCSSAQNADIRSSERQCRALKGVGPYRSWQHESGSGPLTAVGVTGCAASSDLHSHLPGPSLPQLWHRHSGDSTSASLKSGEKTTGPSLLPSPPIFRFRGTAAQQNSHSTHSDTPHITGGHAHRRPQFTPPHRERQCERASERMSHGMRMSARVVTLYWQGMRTLGAKQRMR